MRLFVRKLITGGKTTPFVLMNNVNATKFRVTTLCDSNRRATNYIVRGRGAAMPNPRVNFRGRHSGTPK